MTTLIINGRVLTNETLIDKGAICIKGDIISDVGLTDDLVIKYPNATIFDACGRLVLPGMICAHGHFYGMFSRGMALKDAPPSNFLEVLERLWWRLDKALDHDSIYLSAMVCLAQAIRCGTTTIIDHHASPNYITGSLDTCAKATTEAGLRACLCYEVTDRNGMDGAVLGVAENIRFIRECRRKKNPLLSALFGLHASFTLSNETLAICKQAIDAEEKCSKEPIGIHIHVGEAQDDQDHCESKYSMRVIERLGNAGLLNSSSVLGHCLFVDDKELQKISASKAMVVHNPQSNMNNGVGVADVDAMLSQNICVGLGTDGITYDMFAESKAVYFVHKLNKQDPRVMHQETYQLLFQNNAKMATNLFGHPVGTLTPGSYADVIIVDYNPPTPLSAGNLPWHMQFGMDSSMVQTTVCGGKILMQDRQIIAFDIDSIMNRSRELAPKVWDKF